MVLEQQNMKEHTQPRQNTKQDPLYSCICSSVNSLKLFLRHFALLTPVKLLAEPKQFRTPTFIILLPLKKRSCSLKSFSK